MAESVNKLSLAKRMAKYFHEVKTELKKVVWPTFPQTVNNTIIVITAILIVGVILFILDFIFSGLMSSVLSGSFVNGFMSWFKFK